MGRPWDDHGGTPPEWAAQAREIIRVARTIEQLRVILAWAGHIKAEAEGAIFGAALEKIEERRPQALSMAQAITFKQLALETGFKEWKLREAGRLGPDHGGLRTLRNGTRGVLVERGEGWRWVKAQRR